MWTTWGLKLTGSIVSTTGPLRRSNQSNHHLTSGTTHGGRPVRQHWSIENPQHHILNVTFAEDNRRQSHRHGAANFAAVRRLALSVLRQQKSHQRGAKCKRFACAIDPHYLNKVLSLLKTA